MDKRYTKREIREACDDSNINFTPGSIEEMIVLFAEPISAFEFVENEYSEYVKKYEGLDDISFNLDESLELMIKFAKYLGYKDVVKY